MDNLRPTLLVAMHSCELCHSLGDKGIVHGGRVEAVRRVEGQAAARPHILIPVRWHRISTAR
jgi:hypothetical protein